MPETWHSGKNCNMIKIISISNFVRNYWKSIVVAIVIFHLSTAPGSEFENIPTFPNEDKLVHFLMYFGFAFVLLWDSFNRFGFAISRQKKIMLLLIIGLPVIWGGSMELIQAFFTTTRTGDWLDELTNTIGTIAGFFVGKWILPKFLKNKQ